MPQSMVPAGIARSSRRLEVSGSLEDLHLIVFSIGGSSLREPATFGQIMRLQQHMPHVPVVLLADRDDMDDTIEAMAHGVRGFITTSMALLESAARRNHRLEKAYCHAAGGCADRLDADCDRIDR
jgi:DNA-binding NarL/FixJ family response regulator